MQLMSYTYRCYPTEPQKEILAQTFGCCRLIYNKALAAKSDAWYLEKKRISFKDTSKMLTAWKRTEEFDFLSEVSAVALQQSLRHLDTAFNRFFKGISKYPTFKSKSNNQSATFAGGAVRYDPNNQSLALPKSLGKMKIRWSRPLNALPTTVTISKDASDRYFVAFRIEKDIKPLPKTDRSIGVDLGLKHLAVTSDGSKYDNPRHTQKYEKRLAFLQKQLSRKKKGSSNREKARKKVAKLHAKIADSRLDSLHKLTTKLVNENQVIALESLAVKNMIKNPQLSKHIADASWGELVRQLEYKSNWYGRTTIKIDRFFPSSKRCSDCGHVLPKLDLSIRHWTCPACNSKHDRDINAAINIKEAGHALLVCGDGVKPPRSKRNMAVTICEAETNLRESHVL